MTKKQLSRWLPLFIWMLVIFSISSENNPYRAAWNLATGVYHIFVPSLDSLPPAAPPPTQTAPNTPEVDPRPPLVRAIRQMMRNIDSELVGGVAHFLEYALLGLLMLRALAPPSGTPAPANLPHAAFFGSLSYALMDEFHQIYVPGRSFQLTDLALDALGIALGIWLYPRLRARFTRRA